MREGLEQNNKVRELEQLVDVGRILFAENAPQNAEQRPAILPLLDSRQILLLLCLKFLLCKNKGGVGRGKGGGGERERYVESVTNKYKVY